MRRIHRCRTPIVRLASYDVPAQVIHWQHLQRNIWESSALARLLSRGCHHGQATDRGPHRETPPRLTSSCAPAAWNGWHRHGPARYQIPAGRNKCAGFRRFQLIRARDPAAECRCHDPNGRKPDPNCGPGCRPITRAQLLRGCWRRVRNGVLIRRIAANRRPEEVPSARDDDVPTHVSRVHLVGVDTFVGVRGQRYQLTLRRCPFGQEQSEKNRENAAADRQQTPEQSLPRSRH